VTHACAHPHRHNLRTVPALHYSTPLTSSVTSGHMEKQEMQMEMEVENWNGNSCTI